MLTPKLRYAAGLACVLGVVILWVSSAYIMDALFSANFNKPFFITYVNTGAFSLNLIPLLVKKLRKRYYPSSKNKPNVSVSSDHTVSIHEDQPAEQANLPLRDTALLALQFCFLWFASNFTYNYSISQTTVAKSTVLSTTSGFFTLLLGVLARTERISTAKIIAFCNTIIGVVLVVTHGGEDEAKPGRNDLLGMMLALGSAVLYALYITLFKMRVKDGAGVSLSLFFGLVGVFNIILLWPVLIVLHLTDVEKFSWPEGANDWAMVVGNALFGTVVSDYLWAQATCWTSALVVTLGISLTIPVTFVIDGIKAKGVHHVPVLGAILVLVGFFGINEDEIKASTANTASALPSKEQDLEENGVPIEYYKEKE